MTQQAPTPEAVCEQCGAARVETADWCPRCLRRYDARQHEVAQGTVKSFTVQTRTQKSPLTFGLIGRVLITLPFSIVIAVLMLEMVTKGHIINVLFIIPLLGVGGFALRDVWQKTPKHVPQVASILGQPEDPDKPKPILPPDLYLTDE